MLNVSTAAVESDSSGLLRCEGPDTAQRPYSILVVDDEVRIVDLLRSELEGTYNVFTATSGQEALDIMKSEPVVLLIADQRMPGMSGTELMESIVDTHQDIVRILLTGYTDQTALVDAINRGHVYGYISKPWEPEELKIIVQHSIERYELRRQNRFLIEGLKKKNCELCDALQELQQAQQELLHAERFGTIGKMANMIVHDFKNPLTSVMGLTEMLLTCRIDNEERKNQYYQMIHEETERILKMVQEILEYGRGEELALNREHQDLKAFMVEVYQEIAQHLMGSGIEVILEEVPSGVIFVDRDRFKRVLHNLSGNARDAMHEAGQLTLSAAIRQDHVLFAVSDTGKGIPKELHERIFEPFFTLGKNNGSRLGLAIVKRIVDAHHGEIHIESSDEKGTTFWVTIPLSE